MAPSALFESPFTDAEVRAFIDAAPREVTYSKLAELMADQFGPRRAWSIWRIKAYCLLSGSEMRGHHFKFSADASMLAFIDDRIGRLSLDELTVECRREFGDRRAPSRSSLHRYRQHLAALFRSGARGL